MNYLSKISKKLYYKLIPYIYKHSVISLPDKLKEKKNLFIYFDYEREFSGHSTSINDHQIDQLLSALSDFNIKTTWFTVGKIFNQYPLSIQKIRCLGHEIGSHTFGHISPLSHSAKKLKQDFFLFSKVYPEEIPIYGFHSPRGEWSHKLFSFMKSFRYDVIGSKKNKNIAVFQIKKRDVDLLRFQTLGDDWPLFNKSISEKECYSYFNFLLQNLKKGQLAGIGFHPWILFSNEEIWKGFKRFIQYLSENEDYCLNTASHFMKNL